MGKEKKKKIGLASLLIYVKTVRILIYSAERKSVFILTRLHVYFFPYTHNFVGSRVRENQYR